MEFESYERPHLNGVLGICAEEGWKSHIADPDRSHRAFTAPGVTTIVAGSAVNVFGDDAGRTVTGS